MADIVPSICPLSSHCLKADIDQMYEQSWVDDAQPGGGWKRRSRGKWSDGHGGFFQYDPIMDDMLFSQVPEFSSAFDILVCTPDNKFGCSHRYCIQSSKCLIKCLFSISFQLPVTISLENLYEVEGVSRKNLPLTPDLQGRVT